jgi:hypothetical protein
MYLQALINALGILILWGITPIGTFRTVGDKDQEQPRLVLFRMSSSSFEEVHLTLLLLNKTGELGSYADNQIF